MFDAAPEADPMDLRFAQITTVGDRRSNQDALGNVQQDGLACFVVSDGVGGQEGGEIASGIVVRSILERFLHESSFSPRALRSYVEYAIAQVAERKTEESHLQNMSTTVAALLIDQKNRCALWAHMGDTRVYLFRENKIQRVTKDHSVVQQFVDAGYCSADDLRTHPQRSTLYAAIGQEGDTDPEVVQEMIDVQDGDAFLICSDGLWEGLTDNDMEQALGTSHSAEKWLTDMCNIADVMDRRSAGTITNTALRARDNCTAFAITLGEIDTAHIRPAALAKSGR